LSNENDGNRESIKRNFSFGKVSRGQKEAILSLQAGQDVMVVMPTGGGKSLIYQLASILFSDGVSIVISPLISLMKDQVAYLKGIGVTADYCNSSQDELEQKVVLSRAVTGKIRLLYISPERASSGYFRHLLEKMKINIIIVDEAHCISQWGHDFRPEYRKIHELKSLPTLARVPFVALTATATEKVKIDIINSLDLKNPSIIQTGYFRSNLEFQILFFDTDAQKEASLVDLISKKDSEGRVIIYCATRKKTEEVYQILTLNGIKAGVYHAGKKDEVRESIQNSYTLGKYKILVATNAFGMGIDHPDVRMVIHYQVPASLEAYYQEAGRAGRDGRPARCVLFCKDSDFTVQSFIIGKESNRKGMSTLLSGMKDYSRSTICRQVFLCGYFGQKISPCGKCDICKEKDSHSVHLYLEKQKEKIENKKSKIKTLLPDEEEILYNCIRLYPAMFGKKIITGVLRGSSAMNILRRKLTQSLYYGKLKHLNEESIQHALDLAIDSGKVLVSGVKYPKLYILGSAPKKKTTPSKERTVLSDGKKLLRELKNFRDKQARKLKWKKFMVFQNAVLSRIAEQKPKSLEELSHIKGMGENKLRQFGDEILKIIERGSN
jgi:ATP-dependent DNA helicase RecQ